GLKENRFGIEPELTAKLARAGCRIREVGVRYNGRTSAEGKKIGWRDGLKALWCIVRYWRWGCRRAFSVLGGWGCPGPAASRCAVASALRDCSVALQEEEQY